MWRGACGGVGWLGFRKVAWSGDLDLFSGVSGIVSRMSQVVRCICIEGTYFKSSFTSDLHICCRNHRSCHHVALFGMGATPSGFPDSPDSENPFPDSQNLAREKCIQKVRG